MNETDKEVVRLFRAQYKNIQNLQTSQAYIFPILQHFATKLGNFTNFELLFLAVVKDSKMKIQFKRGMAHWCTEYIVQWVYLINVV